MNTLTLRATALTCALLIAAGCGKKESTIFPAPGTPTMTAGWTMDVKSMSLPDTPVAGKIGGQDFMPDKVELEGDTLVFRQGKGFFADREIKLMLGGDAASFEGYQISVSPEQEFSVATPHVHASSKKGAEPLPETKMYMNKYAMKLELGKVAAGKLPGKIQLALPDESKSFLAGSFSVDASALGSAKLHGKIALKGGLASYPLAVGYVGHDAKGKSKSGMVGFPITPGEVGSASSSGTKLESNKDAVQYAHLRVGPGVYLVYVRLERKLGDCRWVEVKAGDVAADLTVDPTVKGELEVTLPSGSKERKVRLLPLDEGGKLPSSVANPGDMAMQFAFWVDGLAADAPAGKDTVTFPELRPGHYRVFLGKAQADAVVKSGDTAKLAVK